MSRNVNSKDWQSRQLKRWGPLYVSPKEVLALFEEIEHSASVLGRDDWATELSSRVTPVLCQKYAPLLKVLQLLSRNPLNLPLSTLLNGSVTIAAQNSNDAQSIWKEAMKGLEDPQDFKYEDSDEDGNEDAKDSEDYKGNATTSEKLVGTVGNNVRSRNMVQNKTDYTQDSSIDSGETSKIVCLYSLDRMAPEVAQPSQVISQERAVYELALLMQRLPCLDSSSISGISTECYKSLWKVFDQLSESIWTMYSLHKTMALAEICEAARSSSKITTLLVRAEQIVFKYRTKAINESIDVTAINAWLNGDVLKYLNSLDPEFLKNDVLKDKIKIPEILWHENLVDAVLLAAIAKNLYGVSVPCVQVEFKNAFHYRRSVQRVYIQNSECAMRAGLRSCISSVWDRLSAVFLAQDPRVLMYIYKCVSQALDSGKRFHSDRVSIFKSTFPDNNVSLSSDGTPQLTIELPPLLVDIYGENMARLFSVRRLRELWNQIVNAFLTQDQAVELEMASLSRLIRSKISTMKFPEPLL